MPTAIPSPAPPRLIIVCGLPGSGKTTHAEQVEQNLGAVRFCADEWMEALGIDLWDAAARERIAAAMESRTTTPQKWPERRDRVGSVGKVRAGHAANGSPSAGGRGGVTPPRCSGRGSLRQNPPPQHGNAAHHARGHAEWDLLFERPSAEELALFDHEIRPLRTA